QQDENQKRERDEWSDKYKDAEEACRFGDPLLGFTKAVELPKLTSTTAATPDTNDLLGQLARRLGAQAEELNVPVDAPLDLLNEEERFLDLLGEFQDLMKNMTVPPEAHSFQFRIDELATEVRSRRATRANQREKLLAKEKEKDQDILLATARAHDQ